MDSQTLKNIDVEAVAQAIEALMWAKRCLVCVSMTLAFDRGDARYQCEERKEYAERGKTTGIA